MVTDGKFPKVIGTKKNFTTLHFVEITFIDQGSRNYSKVISVFGAFRMRIHFPVHPCTVAMGAVCSLHRRSCKERSGNAALRGHKIYSLPSHTLTQGALSDQSGICINKAVKEKCHSLNYVGNCQAPKRFVNIMQGHHVRTRKKISFNGFGRFSAENNHFLKVL